MKKLIALIAGIIVFAGALTPLLAAGDTSQVQNKISDHSRSWRFF